MNIQFLLISFNVSIYILINLEHGYLHIQVIFCVQAGMVGLAPKWVRLDPKVDKSGTFSDQISVHLAR